MLLTPTAPRPQIIRCVRGPMKGRRASLPFMADRAGEIGQLMRTVFTYEQIETRMFRVGLRQTSPHRNAQRPTRGFVS